MSSKFDDILQMSGAFGRWHWLFLSIASFNGVVYLWHTYGLIYWGAVPDHWCYVPELREANWTTEEVKISAIPHETRHGDLRWNRCEMWDRDYKALIEGNASEPSELFNRKMCADGHGYEYDTTEFTSTVATEWNLVCSRLPLLSTIQTVYMLGLLFGSLFSGAFSDKYGRRSSIILCAAIVIVSSFSSYFAMNYEMLLVTRFFTGAGCVGLYATCMVLVAELSPSKRRNATVFAVDLFPTFGSATVGLVSYFFRDWRSLLLVYAFPSLFYLSYYWLIFESPRWLILNNRLDEAEDTLTRTANWYKKTLKPAELKKLIGEIDDIDSAMMRNKVSFLASTKNALVKLFRTREMRRRSVCMFFSWFTIGLATTGMAFNFANLPFNRFLVHAINGSILMVARIALIIFPLADYIGRKRCYISFLVLGGLAGLVILAVPQDVSWIMVTVSLVCSILLTIPFTIVYLYTAELFPTEIRNVGVCIGSVCARIGGMVSPFVVDLLGSYHHTIPTAIFGIVCVVAGGICVLLPETNGEKLAETVEEIEEAADKKRRARREDDIDQHADISKAVMEHDFTALYIGIK